MEGEPRPDYVAQLLADRERRRREELSAALIDSPPAAGGVGGPDARERALARRADDIVERLLEQRRRELEARQAAAHARADAATAAAAAPPPPPPPPPPPRSGSRPQSARGSPSRAARRLSREARSLSPPGSARAAWRAAERALPLGGGARGRLGAGGHYVVDRGDEDRYVTSALDELVGGASRAGSRERGGEARAAASAAPRARSAERAWAAPAAFATGAGAGGAAIPSYSRPRGLDAPARSSSRARAAAAADSRLARARSPARPAADGRAAAAAAARAETNAAEDGSDAGARLSALAAPRRPPPFTQRRPATAAAADADAAARPWFAPAPISERTRLLAQRHERRQRRRDAARAAAGAELAVAFASSGDDDDDDGEDDDEHERSTPRWVERLGQDRAAVFAQREAARHAAAAAEADTLLRTRGRAAAEPDAARSAGARLHALALARREAAAEKAAAAARAAASAEARPAINPTSHTIVAGSYVPLEQRAAQVLKQRAARVHSLRLALAERDASVCTFRPHTAASQVNGALAALGAAAAGGGGGFDNSAEDVGARLLARGEAQLERADLRRREAEDERARVCTFAPTTNRTSARILESSGTLAGSSFFERQHAYAELRERRADEAEAEAAARAPAFRPRLDANSEAIAAAAGEAAGALRALPLEQRLGAADAARRRAAQDARREAHFAKFQFQPAIDPVSRALDAAGGGRGGGGEPRAERLYRNERAAAARLDAAAAAAEAFRQRHTFAPRVLEASRKMARAAGQGERFTADAVQAGVLSEAIEAERQRRDARTEALRRASEAAELANCTFQPQRLAPTREWTRQAMEVPVVVAGLDRHLELRELTRKQAEEQRRREAAAFYLDIGDRLADHARETAHMPYTVPQPFAFATDERHDKDTRFERVRESVRQREVRECTFQPNTGRQLVGY